MKKLCLIGLIIISMIMSCDNDENINQFFWNQTKCADPWNTGENSSNEETRIAITSFLKDKLKAIIINVSFDGKSPLDVFCESCGCGTGQRIIIDIVNPDTPKMEELGFY